MKSRLLNYICCPSCFADFDLIIKEQEGEEIITGELKCRSCQNVYPITGAIPRILLSNIAPDKKKTAAAFAYEWQRFSTLTDKYQKQFLDWIYPVTADFFKDKIVLDAGSGKGRHAFLAAKFGAKEVIGIDLGQSVEVAYQNLKQFNNVHIIQADIYHLPFKNIFDYIYSVGVLHHLPDPEAGFGALAKHLKTGGKISAWVYGREGNWWIIYLVNPVRKLITSRLPLIFTKFFSFILSLILVPVLKIIYYPVEKIKFLRPLKKFLFYSDYLCYISEFSFKEIYSIVFDHLLAPTAFYISRPEFERWFLKNNLPSAKIFWHNKNSWKGTAEKI